MGKRGMSAEEKRAAMMRFFFEKKTFFHLKEVEKICSKEYGITSMSVKDVLQSLVDDDMVDSDKIGSSSYYWALPSKGLHTRKRKLERLNAELKDLEEKKVKLETGISAAKVDREETTQRKTLLGELEKEEKMNAQLKQKYASIQTCDPDALKAKATKSKQAKEAANRWTDNIFCAKSWAERKLGGSYNEKAFNMQMGIPQDFDYIE
eukprot:m.147857 g.147857  ORF g.147857 m.147857 type:complete len:207 (+) comp14994_c0_seq1:58-678(+)